MTKYQAAEQLREAGFYVFRLRPNQKTPAFFGWQFEATRDPEKVKSYFDNNKDYNIGIFTEKFAMYGANDYALVVVDVDTKDGKQGNNTMSGLDALGCDFPPTIEQTTASGGKHIIYITDTALASGANKLGPHVDLKSSGGYIVGAGSTIDNIPYTMQNPGFPAPAVVPEWIPLRCHPPMAKTAHASAIADDSEQAVSRATLLANQTEASAGGRNDQAFKLGCQIRDYGVSQTMTEEILHGWNAINVHPALNPEEITAVCHSVFQYAKLAQGNKSPQSDFTVVPHDPKIDDENKQRFYRVNWEDIKNNTNMRPLVKGYLDQDSVSIGYGDSNAGKTFLFVDLAYHIAAGKPWAGRKTMQGGVVYLAAEGGRSLANRVEALRQTYGPHPVPFTLIPCQFNLLDSNTDFKAFITLIEEAEKDPKIGAVRLIVIDTLSRALHGGDENASTDAGKIITNITFIKERFKCHVLLVHHSGKDTTKGARGHSLLRAAVDTELEVIATGDHVGILKTRKQRDMDFAPPLGFKLNIIPVGTDEDNEPVTSCAVTYHDPGALEDQENFKMEPRDTMAFLSLQSIKNNRTLNGHTNVVETKVWKEVCKDFNIRFVSGAKPWPKSANSYAHAFSRCQDRLTGFGLVEEIEKDQWVILNQDSGVPAGHSVLSRQDSDTPL